MDFVQMLAYVLALILALLVGTGVGLLVKFGGLFIISRVVGIQKMALNMVRYMRPMDFVAGLLQAAFAVWFGGWILSLFSVKVDFFISVLILAGYLWIDLPKIRKTPDIPMDALFGAMQNRLPQAGGMGAGGAQTDAQKAAFQAMMQNNPMFDQLREMMRQGRIVGLIGKVTGIALMLMNLLWQ